MTPPRAVVTNSALGQPQDESDGVFCNRAGIAGSLVYDAHARLGAGRHIHSVVTGAVAGHRQQIGTTV